MNILDLHVNCHVALHPKQLEQTDSMQRYGSKSSSVIKETPNSNLTTQNMEFEESAFKYQPFKRPSNDIDSSSVNYQNSPLYNVYDKWHCYPVNPMERYGTSEYHNGIIPFGPCSFSDQSGTNSYMDVSYRRYTSDLYGHVYDQPLQDSGFYPYTSNFNPYLNLCENSHQVSSSYYPTKSRYQLSQNGYRSFQESDLGSLTDNKSDNHWYVLPTSRASSSTTESDQVTSNQYDYQSSTYTGAAGAGHRTNSYTEKSPRAATSFDYGNKMASQYGKSPKPGKGATNFTLHVRKQERKLKKRLKELQSKNCDKAAQLQEYYHFKVIMIEKQAQQRQQADPLLSSSEASEDTDVQILQLVHEMEERINAFQFTLNDEIPDKYGQVCSEVRKTRLLPKHAIKKLESWYEDNLSNPYPSRDQTVRLALDCGLTIEQVRKWFANKRNRSRNNKLHLLK